MERAQIAYKVLTADEAQQLQADHRFDGSPDDRRDGFIHLSTAEQLEGTLSRHFAGQNGLWLVAIDVEAAGEQLRWEPSRGGGEFPHLYGAILLDEVIAYAELAREPDGSIRLPVAG